MIGFGRERLRAPRDRVGEALAVALGRQVALELGDEQAAVREDQDRRACGPPRRSRRRRSSCRRRSGGGSGSGGPRRGPRRRSLRLVVVALGAVLARRRGRPRPPAPRRRARRRRRGRCRCRSPSSSASRWFAAISSVSIPASASTWCRRSSVPDAVAGGFEESTRSRPSMSPKRTFQRGDGVAPAGGDLGERLVERAAARRAGRERPRRGPRRRGGRARRPSPVLGARRPSGLRRVRRECRVQYRF